MGKKNNKYGNKLSEKKIAKINKKVDESDLTKKIVAEAMKDPVGYTSRHVNKKFRLKKVEKGTKKYLLTGCEHVYVNKKDRRKAALKSAGNGIGVCRICGRKVSTDLITEEEFDRAFEGVGTVLDQTGFSIGILNLGVPADRAHHMMMYRLDRYKKFSGKVLKLVAKDGAVHGKNKNNNGYNGNNDGPAGGWF